MIANVCVSCKERKACLLKFQNRFMNFTFVAHETCINQETVMKMEIIFQSWYYDILFVILNVKVIH